ncbi:uncharacterized protein B0H18DRAFT_1010949 [Fomitopsis serialis]|uniref:uncharacterized protein n=1 Tax=Fomitopsis serialis TaxID=139415 RepID=UPI002008DA99|nr:uncharacterized protein B0H18DRAFT_1010949 [Neoantrodia serialis]KAH9924731.1 hypothetical protein B0H18DRAFT_1010949 [Neoantrodia serialis]
MATNLYETLGLDRNASPEDVRKAYRKRALKTHPDRLSLQTSEADKATAAEEFRKVNNAYEVLSDEENRKLYDRHGVWPPPTAPDPDARASQNYYQSSFNQPFSDPFFSSGFGGRSFAFTDPFELFSSLFGDIHNLHRGFFEDDDPFFSNPFPTSSSRSPFGDPFGLSTRSPFGSLFGPGPMFSGLLDSPNTRSYSQVNEAVGRSGQWVSQSTMTRSINGRTEQITKRRDARGNEHVVYSSPDGERYTVNGVEQPLPIAATQPPPAYTRSLPQTITAGPPPQASSYYMPPPAQPQLVHTTSRPPTYHTNSVSSASRVYPSKPAPSVDRAPVRHRDAMDVDSPTSFGDAHASSLHSYNSDRDRSHRRDTYRDPQHRNSHQSSSDSRRSHHDYQPVRAATADGDAHRHSSGDKQRRLGGWLNALTKLLRHRVRRHDTSH